LSIAMAEAMAAGVVPVVADIGELGDLVVDGVNGYLIEPGNITDYAAKAMSLLQNDALWSQYSYNAVEAARARCDIDVVSEQWRRRLQEVIYRASGCPSSEVHICRTS